LRNAKFRPFPNEVRPLRGHDDFVRIIFRSRRERAAPGKARPASDSRPTHPDSEVDVVVEQSLRREMRCPENRPMMEIVGS
jgi:hypothetical protein